MKEIKCPKCGEVFVVDESGYAQIVQQVRDKEFDKELKQREKDLEEIKKKDLELIKTKQKDEFNKAISTKDLQLVEKNKLIEQLTGTGDYVRCTSIECSYRDGKFWMFSEGGEKITLAALKKLEVPMNLICATPVKIEVLCSEFKKEGYSSRQTYEC